MEKVNLYIWGNDENGIWEMDLKGIQQHEAERIVKNVTHEDHSIESVVM